jgi:hypothetical protein
MGPRMHTSYLPAFDQAMQFLYEKHGNAISEDLVQAYCVQGLLSEEDGVLKLTDRGRAILRKAPVARQLRPLQL